MTDGDARSLFLANFQSAHAIARRLLASKVALRSLMPLDEAWFQCAGDDEYVLLDAFIQRFGSFQDTLHGPVFRGLLMLEEYTEMPKTPRDLADLMEKLGIIDKAAEWHELRKLRNALAHEYPNDRTTQARRLNDAYHAVDTLIAVLYRVREHVTAKGLADLSACPPL